MYNLNEQLRINKILIPTKNGFIFEEMDNIVYFKSKGNYAMIKMISGKEILSTKSLKIYEENYTNGQFLRVHKSYLVNIKHIIEYNFNDNYYVKLKNDDFIKIAVRKRSYVKKVFINGCKLN